MAFHEIDFGGRLSVPPDFGVLSAVNPRFGMTNSSA